MWARMGNIKTRTIKRAGYKLASTYPELFAKDFAENKKVVAQLMTADSKKSLNKVAGYVTRIKRKEERQEAVLDQ